jgi:SAM-dependent methyltransferase
VTPTAVLFDSLRLARSLVLRLLEPIDRMRRIVIRRQDLPPLHLRRHAGPIASYDRAVADTAGRLDRLGLVRPDDLVLDLGCGPGSMAAPLGNRIGAKGRYVGIDVHRASLRWAARRFSGDPRMRFELAPVSSPYGSRRDAPAGRYRLPLGDGSVQLVLAKSLFTHLLEEEAAAYMSEIRRVIEPGRAALVSAFLFEPGSSADRGRCSWFRYPGPGARVRYRFRHRPEAAVAYEQSRFLSLVERAGLRVQWLSPGFLPGEDPVPRGQDFLLLGI